MRLHGKTSICLLVLLLCVIFVSNAQAAPKSGEKKSGEKKSGEKKSGEKTSGETTSSGTTNGGTTNGGTTNGGTTSGGTTSSGTTSGGVTSGGVTSDETTTTEKTSSEKTGSDSSSSEGSKESSSSEIIDNSNSNITGSEVKEDIYRIVQYARSTKYIGPIINLFFNVIQIFTPLLPSTIISQCNNYVNDAVVALVNIILIFNYCVHQLYFYATPFVQLHFFSY